MSWQILCATYIGSSAIVTIPPTYMGPSIVVTIPPSYIGKSVVVTLNPTYTGPSVVVTLLIIWSILCKTFRFELWLQRCPSTGVSQYLPNGLFLWSFIIEKVVNDLTLFGLATFRPNVVHSFGLEHSIDVAIARRWTSGWSLQKKNILNGCTKQQIQKVTFDLLWNGAIEELLMIWNFYYTPNSNQVTNTNID